MHSPSTATPSCAHFGGSYSMSPGSQTYSSSASQRVRIFPDSCVVWLSHRTPFSVTNESMRFYCFSSVRERVELNRFP